MPYGWTLLYLLWCLAALLLIYGHGRRYALLARGLRQAFDPPGPPAPPVSLLICARNEASHLEAHLPLWLEQLHPEFELIVVNDGSTDATGEVLARWAARDSRLRPVPHLAEGPGKKGALAAGIAAARYPHLVLTDADCRPLSRHWLAEMGAAFGQKRLVLGYGRLTGKGLLGGLVAFETVQTAFQYWAAALAGQAYMGVGRNMAYHRSVYEAAGGFEKHADLASGDDDLLLTGPQRPVAAAIMPRQTAFTTSEGPVTWRAWWRQKARHYSTGWRYTPGRRYRLAAEGALQLYFYAALPVALLVGPWWIVLALLAWRLSYAYGMMAWVRHLQGSARFWYAFPFWEALWAGATSLQHLARLLGWRPRRWR
jgi:glycosyltransferase involved in cell wall biosynthesis